MRMTPPKLATLAAATFSLLALVALCSLVIPMRPVAPGTSNEFWESAAKVAPHPTGGMGGRALLEGDNAGVLTASFVIAAADPHAHPFSGITFPHSGHFSPGWWARRS